MAQWLDVSRLTWAGVGLILLGVAYYVVTTIVSYRKLQHIPGPRLAAISELWMFNVTAKGDIYLEMEKTLRKYGILHLPTMPPSILGS